MEAWQHVELTVTNCSFGLTIKFIVNTAVFSFCGPSIFKEAVSGQLSAFGLERFRAEC